MAAHDEVPSSVNYPSDIDRQEIKEIRDILGGFVSKKASNDTTIGEDRSSILASFIEEQDSTKCTEVGQILGGIADEIDSAHSGIIQDLMGIVGAPDVAFRTFRSVAEGLFSLHSSGGQIVSITWRKIAALLGFCYSLCRQFLLSTDESTDNQISLRRSLGAFFTAVVGFLARFLFERRLLNWIHSQGGWMSVLQQPISHVSWRAVAGIGIGLAFVGILAYSQFAS